MGFMISTATSTVATRTDDLVLAGHLKSKRVKVDVADAHRNRFPKVSELNRYDSIIITGSRAAVYENAR